MSEAADVTSKLPPLAARVPATVLPSRVKLPSLLVTSPATLLPLPRVIVPLLVAEARLPPTAENVALDALVTVPAVELLREVVPAVLLISCRAAF